MFRGESVEYDSGSMKTAGAAQKIGQQSTVVDVVEGSHELIVTEKAWLKKGPHMNPSGGEAAVTDAGDEMVLEAAVNGQANAIFYV